MAKLMGTFRDLPHKLHLSSGGKAKASDKQLKQYKDFFDLGELCKIGFPDNATTIAHDTQLSLLAIGTKTGEILIFGAPGHEFSACHKDVCEVKQLIFLPEEGRLVSLTSDNRLHKWELNANSECPTGANWRLEHVSDLLAGPTGGEDGQTASCMALVGGDRLWVGYESGSVRLIHTKDWKFTDVATSGDAIAKSLTEEACSQVQGWGAVIAMEASPANGKQVAVGFSSGTVAVLNSSDCALHSLAPGACDLRCLSWQTDGSSLYTGHADGSHAVWRADQPAEASRLLKTSDNPQTVYGPFPCLPVTRIIHRTAKLGAFTVMSGGMAKNTHADRHTVTLLREQEHVCLDLCSPVVDLALLCSPGDGNTGQAGYDEPHTLLVLCESQLVALDLYGAQWPEFRLPYLTSVSGTGAPVTAARIYGSGVASAEQMRAAVLTAGAADTGGVAYSSRAWPITGGKPLVADATEAPEAGAATGEEPAANTAAATTSAGEVDAQLKVPAWDMLVTGHADGSVAFWQIGGGCGGTSASLLYTLHTADVFSDAPVHHCGDIAADAGSFPPFRAAGRRWRAVSGDETDNGRFAVTAIELAGDCLLVGGATGQATMWRLAAAADTGAPVEVDVRTVNADIVTPGKDSPYAWEGQAPLRVREDPWQPPTGRLFEPASIALAFPPDRVCSLALDVTHGLAAVGTGFGLALIDTGANRCLTAHCTLTQQAPQAASAAGASATSPTTPAKSSGATASGSGGSSITKSLRQSFRRLKKLRGGKRQEYTVTAEEGGAAADAAGPSTSAEPAEAPAAEEGAAAASPSAPASDKKKKDKKEEKKEKKDKKAEKKAEEKKAEEKKAEEKKEAKADADEKKEEKTEEKKDAEKTEEKKEDEPEKKAEEGEPSCSSAKPAETDETPAAVLPPPEKQKQPLTAQVAADSLGRVRCLLIADSHLLTAGTSTPALFAGDRAGRVYAFQVEVTAAGTDAGKKQARLAKELHLRHGAPVVAMHVTGEQQQLIVASEQQVKLFALPSLRPRCKARLLPAEAPARLRACGLAQFRPAGTPGQQAPIAGLAVEDSLGRLLVLGLPQLKILAQLDRADPAAAGGSLAFQPAGAANPLAVAVAGKARVRLVRLSAVAAIGQQQQHRYVTPAGLDLPESARPAKAAVPSVTPAASIAASATGADTDSPAAAASASPDIAEHETELTPDADADRSHHQVAADITMDDIKEYAAATPLPPTDTIPEANDEKQEVVAADTADADAEEQKVAPEEAASEPAVADTSDVAPEEVATHSQEKEEVPAAEVKACGDNDQMATPNSTIAAGDVVTEQ